MENKITIRGGFGLFYTNIQDESGFIEVGDAPYGDYYSSSIQAILSTPFIELTGTVNCCPPVPLYLPG